MDEDELMDALDMLECDMAEDEALGVGGNEEPDYLQVRPLDTPSTQPIAQGGQALDEFGLPVAAAQPIAQ